MTRLRIGTCSWKYPSWDGLVYSAPKGINYLEEYARQFDTVEIDQWFWSLHGPGNISLPRSGVAEEYAASVPEDFRFSVKVPNSVTLSHFYRKSRNQPLVENPDFLSVDLFNRFLDALTPMHHLLGPLMLQFEYLNKEKMPVPGLFLDRLDAFLTQVPTGFILGIESRNPNYFTKTYFELLNSHGVHHVFLQGYYMPPVTEVFGKSGIPASGTSVLRLHGPDRKGMEKKSGGEWNRRIEPREDELEDVLGLVRALLEREIDVFLNVNNHYEGSAPMTIARIREMLGLS